MKQKRVICLFVFAFLFISVAINPILFAQDDKPKSRLISLVYDDSNSMIKNDDGVYVDTWCQAKYAMEVFAAMLDTNDTLKIFVMSDFMDRTNSAPRLIINGKDNVDESVERIHSMLTTARGTPYSAVKMAFGSLASSVADEKWLVILTDGEFTDASNAAVNSDFSRFVKNRDVRIIFLAIGDKTSEIAENEDAGIFSEKAETSERILVELTNICNRIFQRNFLEFQDKSKYQLNIDIPMKEILVLAQGTNIELKGLRGEKANYLPNSSVDVTFSEKAALNHLNDPGILVDRNLKGTVSTFEQLPAGTYRLDLKGASTANVYYKPDVKIGLKIFSGNMEVTDKNKLVGGDYRVEFGFMNDKNEFIQSELLGNVDYSAALYSNGKLVNEKIPSGTTLPLAQGETKIDLTAKFLDYNKVDTSLRYRVLKPASPLSLKYNRLQDDYKLSSFGSDESGFLVSVSQDGKHLPKEQWDTMELPTVSSDRNIDFAVRKGKEVSTFEIIPSWNEGNKFETETGEAKIKITAEMLYDEQLSKGESTTSFNVVDDISRLERFKYWYSKYGTISIALIFLIVAILGYLPFIKKYLPKRLNRRPVIRETSADYSSIRAPNTHYGKCRISLLSTYLPYIPQTAEIVFLPRGVSRGFGNILRVKAAGGGRMMLKNAKDFAGKTNLKFNGDFLPKETNSKFINLSTTISTITDGRRYECTLRK